MEKQRITIRLPLVVIEKINEYAQENKLNRSAVVRLAIVRHLKEVK